MESLKEKFGNQLPFIRVKCEINEDDVIDVQEIVKGYVEMNVTQGKDEHGNSTQVVNIKKAAREIKEEMDKKFGPTWQCVIGEGMSFSIKYQQNSMFYGVQDNLAVLVYKS